MRSATKKKTSDSVANCIYGDGTREFDRKSMYSGRSESDNSRTFGLSTAEAHALNNREGQPHANSFEIMQHKDIAPNDIEADDYNKQRTKEEVN